MDSVNQWRVLFPVGASMFYFSVTVTIFSGCICDGRTRTHFPILAVVVVNFYLIYYIRFGPVVYIGPYFLQVR